MGSTRSYSVSQFLCFTARFLLTVRLTTSLLDSLLPIMPSDPVVPPTRVLAIASHVGSPAPVHASGSHD